MRNLLMERYFMINQIKIIFENTGKKFGSDWVLKDFSFTLNPSGQVAILGPNGSGKSTLLQMIAGYVQPSSGKISFYNDDVFIEEENIFRHISLAAPYLELIEEYSLEEMVKFHFGFKSIINGMNNRDVIERSGL